MVRWAETQNIAGCVWAVVRTAQRPNMSTFGVWSGWSLDDDTANLTTMIMQGLDRRGNFCVSDDPLDCRFNSERRHRSSEDQGHVIGDGVVGYSDETVSPDLVARRADLRPVGLDPIETGIAVAPQR